MGACRRRRGIKQRVASVWQEPAMRRLQSVNGHLWTLQNSQ